MKANSFNIIVRLQHWMDSVPGQTFLNYAYSWGASIVILGALFKLTHLYGADIMLFIGMGTEVVVFFLSAFDRPFDKTDETPDLSEEPEEDEQSEGIEGAEQTSSALSGSGVTTAGIPVAGGGTIIIGGGTAAMAATASESAEASTGAAEAVHGSASRNAGEGTAATAAGIASQTSAVLAGASAAADPELPEAMKNYVEKLKELTDVLAKVEEQSRKMTTDSEEMVNLNRTLTGINTVYELQLKSISAQVGTIDRINEQTLRMAKQIEELNAMYGRMIKALTINMRNAASAQAAATPGE